MLTTHVGSDSDFGVAVDDFLEMMARQEDDEDEKLSDAERIRKNVSRYLEGLYVRTTHYTTWLIEKRKRDAQGE